MTDLRAVLGYMADVAEMSTSARTTDVGKVAWLGWNVPDEPITVRRAREGDLYNDVERLASIDRLHREESLVWQGWLWIAGTHEDRRYRWPVLRRRVHLARRLPSGNEPVLRVEPTGTWELTPGLCPQESLDSLAARREEWGVSLAPHFHWSGELRKYPKLRWWVRDYLRACGLPKDTGVRSAGRGHAAVRDSPEDAGELRVIAGTGLYLIRHPFQLDRTSILRLWRRHQVAGTAVAGLYGSSAERDLDLDERSVRTPLPLNHRQRAAIDAATLRPVSVVSGPPGTGKSHLVAAAAISEVAAGRSVLVAAQSLHACDVIGELLQRHPSVEPLRFGQTGSARTLGDRLAAGVPPEDERYDMSRLQNRLGDLDEEIAQQRRRITTRIGQADGFDTALRRREDIPLWLAVRGTDNIVVDDLHALARRLESDGWTAAVRHRLAKRRLRRMLGANAPTRPEPLVELIEALEAERSVDAIAGRSLGLGAMWGELESLEDRWRELVGDLLEAQRRERAGRRARAALGDLASALRKETTTRRELFGELGDRFLDVAPLWLGTLGEIEATLPIEPGLFDLVILDEASQISQLSAVPALARATRAMIVGDSRQLRHVSFVSDDSQRTAAAEHGLSEQLRTRLDDRVNSLFDAAAAVAPVIELDEHFRSAPHIIGFSDRTFYNGRLKLMTQHPRNESRDAIEVRRLIGERNDAGVVEIEVSEALSLVRELAAAGADSVGIVSPFRKQADAIEAAVLESFTLEEIEQCRLRVGTVHGFQGTERDHMIISLGLGAEDTRSRAFVEDPAIFNVMVTRARTHVTVLTCLDRSTAGSGLLADYFRHADEPPMARRPQVHASGWTERLAAEIADNTDARVITDYEVAGETIDIVVGTGEDAIGLETEMHPAGVDRHIERHLALRRAGWTIESMYRASCYGREEEAIAELLARFA